MRVRFIAAVLAAAAALPARAQEALYGPQPPPGSAYLRFASTLPAAITVSGDFMQPQRLGVADTARIGPYFVIERVRGRPLPFAVGGANEPARATVQVEPGSFTTVLLGRRPDGSLQATPVRDKADFNQARAALSFYNAAPRCAAAALQLDPANTAVFQNVAPGTAASRDVSPVEAQLRAVCDGVPTAPFALTGLEAGTRFSIWLMPTDPTPTAFMGRDTVQRYKP